MKAGGCEKGAKLMQLAKISNPSGTHSRAASLAFIVGIRPCGGDADGVEIGEALGAVPLRLRARVIQVEAIEACAGVTGMHVASPAGSNVKGLARRKHGATPMDAVR